MKSRFPNLRIGKQVLRLLFRIFNQMPGPAALWIVLPLLQGLLVIPFYGAQQSLIDAVADQAVSRPAGGVPAAVWLPLALLLGSACLRVLLEAWSRVAGVRLIRLASGSIQREVQARAIREPLERMEQASYYDRLQRAEKAAGDELLAMLQQTLLLLQLLFEAASVLAAVALAMPAAGWILAAVGLFALAVRVESELHVRRLNREQTRPGRQAEYLREEAVRPSTVKELRLLGSLDRLMAKWRGVAAGSLALRMDARRREIRHGIWVSLAQLAGWAGCLVWMLLHLDEGSVSAGAIVIVLMGMRQLFRAAFRMSFPISKLVLQSAQLADLTAFLEEPVEPAGEPLPDPEPERKREGSGQTPGLEARIRFEEVSFAYNASDPPVVHGIRLELQPGETVALVGPNGAGKSTLVRLLLGLYHPTAGRLTWDGVDYRALDPEQLRSSMSAVFQDFVRYETTLRDNIALAVPGRLPDDASIRNALQVGGMEALEAELGELGGLDARVGLLQERGRELSGGQWQRLALARAAWRDPRLLVLDEPTAALDPQHETELYRSFRELAAGRTAVFVSHRLGWARFADRILVLQQGRLVEEGTHEALMAAGGAYAAMFREQAAWYTDTLRIESKGGPAA